MILLDGDGHLSFLQHIIHWDYWLFAKINQEWTSPLLDGVFPYIREAEIWLPLYLFLLVFSLMNFGKMGGIWSVGLAMTGIISDLISSSIVKNTIIRLRPCHQPAIAETMRLLVAYCPESSSFTSSHACNHFSASMFIFLTMRHISKWWGLIFLWAAIISYAQVYVGVHYPIDVFCGALLGCGIGYIMSNLFKKQFGLPGLEPSK